ncbi:hypothetical protein GCM10028802_05840 [Terrabacter terrigena]
MEGRALATSDGTSAIVGSDPPHAASEVTTSTAVASPTMADVRGAGADVRRRGHPTAYGRGASALVSGSIVRLNA